MNVGICVKWENNDDHPTNKRLLKAEEGKRNGVGKILGSEIQRENTRKCRGTKGNQREGCELRLGYGEINQAKFRAQLVGS